MPYRRERVVGWRAGLRGAVGHRGDNGLMSDDVGGLSVRQGPRKRAGDVRVADFTLLVRVEGRPAAVRVFTDDEADEAAQYAASTGGVVVPLPLSPPAGYVRGPDGSLLPEGAAGASPLA